MQPSGYGVVYPLTQASQGHRDGDSHLGKWAPPPCPAHCSLTPGTTGSSHHRRGEHGVSQYHRGQYHGRTGQGSHPQIRYGHAFFPSYGTVPYGTVICLGFGQHHPRQFADGESAPRSTRRSTTALPSSSSPRLRAEPLPKAELDSTISVGGLGAARLLALHYPSGPPPRRSTRRRLH